MSLCVGSVTRIMLCKRLIFMFEDLVGDDDDEVNVAMPVACLERLVFPCFLRRLCFLTQHKIFSAVLSLLISALIGDDDGHT